MVWILAVVVILFVGLAAGLVAVSGAKPRTAHREDWLRVAKVIIPAYGLMALWLHWWILRPSRRRRRVWLTPFPPEWEETVSRIPYVQRLDPERANTLRQRMKLFVAETPVYGAGAYQPSPADIARLAAAAVIPTMGFPEWEWWGLREVILRPGGYDKGEYVDDDGVVSEYEESGMVGEEGVLNGVMMIAPDDLEYEFLRPEEGANVGYHEFAHLFDAGYGGVAKGPPWPSLPQGVSKEAWGVLVKSECGRIENGDSLLDEYALTNDAEFFAVASEFFFSAPARLRDGHPELHRFLSELYCQDPAAGVDAPERAVKRVRARRDRRHARQRQPEIRG